MLQIHPNARTTPVTRAEIARSGGPIGLLAQRCGVSTETIRKWRKRGAEDCLDHSVKPHGLPWKATEEERAIVCAVCRATNFSLDDLTFVVSHFLPHLNRDSIWRILNLEGLNRRAKPVAERPPKGQGTFKDYDLDFVHNDIKHLPKLQTADGERRKRTLFVAINRCSRSVHLAVKDDETERRAIAFLREEHCWHRQVEWPPAWPGWGSRVSASNDDAPRPTLRRLLLPRRAHQLRGLAVFSVPVKPTYS